MTMPGLSRFDFYPRDWFLDTRELSQPAKGCYIDLLSAMYNRGGPLPHDEKFLCALTGHKQVRPLRRLLQELLDTDKLKIVDGHLVNNRAMEEISAANNRIGTASKGGQAKREKTSFGKKTLKLSRNIDETLPKPEVGFKQNQQLDPCSPSPSPPPPKNTPLRGEAGASSTSPKKVDPAKQVFDLGKSLLAKRGHAPHKAGGLVQKWRRQLANDDAALLAILHHAGEAERHDVVAYVEGCIREHRNGTAAGDERPIDPETGLPIRSVEEFTADADAVIADAHRMGRFDG
jgi:uncharacterized protein YdaU (DUF1376 family)